MGILRATRCPLSLGCRSDWTPFRCPATVIWGDRDPYIPFGTARELADRIPDATLIRLRGGDHYIMEERPREVTDALLELLARPAVPLAD